MKEHYEKLQPAIRKFETYLKKTIRNDVSVKQATQFLQKQTSLSEVRIDVEEDDMDENFIM